MSRLIALVLLLALGAASFAHNGEYKVPLPPPFLNPGNTGPSAGPGVPTWRRKVPAVPTPPLETGGPGEVVPESTPPEIPGRTFRRRDDRFRWDHWWELDRPLFLGERPVLSGAAREMALEALRSSLTDASPLVRGRALVALARLGESRALSAALSTVETGRASQHAAILALGLLGGESATDALKKVATSEARSIVSRSLALAALGLQAEPRHAPFLREVVDEETRPNLRSAAVLALGMVEDRESVARLRRLLVPRAAGSGRGDLDPLDDLVRCASAYALGRIGTDPGRMALLNALRTGDGLAGGGAALALGRLGDSAAKAALRETVTSDRPVPARAMAIVSLARHADAALAEPLMRLLGEPGLRRTNLLGVALLALGRVGTSAHADALIATLADEAIPPGNRAAAAAGLGLLAARRGIAPLTEALGGARDPLLRGHIVLALARLKAPGAGAAIAENVEKGRTQALWRLTVDAIAANAGPEATSRLLDALEREYYVNREAARALARIDTSRALTGILVRHGDRENPLARRFAADALGWLLTRDRPAIDVVRGLTLLSGMPLIQAILFLGGEDYLYDITQEL